MSYEAIIHFSENCEEIAVSFYVSEVDPHHCDHFAYGRFHQCSTGKAAATQCKVNHIVTLKV